MGGRDGEMLKGDGEDLAEIAEWSENCFSEEESYLGNPFEASERIRGAESNLGV